MLGNRAVKAVIKVLQGPKGGTPADRTPGLIRRETGGGGQKPWGQARRGEAALPGTSPADPGPRRPASRMRSRYPCLSPGLASCSGSQSSWKQSEEKKHKYTLTHHHSAWESMKHTASANYVWRTNKTHNKVNFNLKDMINFIISQIIQFHQCCAQIIIKQKIIWKEICVSVTNKTVLHKGLRSVFLTF